MHKRRTQEKGVISGKPQVRIGKYGITDNLLKEIARYLKKDKVVKVKVLRSFLKGDVHARDLAEEVAKRTSSKVIDVRGHTFTIAKYSKSKGTIK